jgi:leucyl/phenylalanyl-tRNA---protein transferase
MAADGASSNPITKAEITLARKMLTLYREGWFPMGDADGRVEWFRVSDRAMVPLDERFHVSRSLAKVLRQGKFIVTTDVDFSGVINACASVPRTQEGTAWLQPAIIAAFETMHRAGHAHSVEVRTRDSGLLVGGIYGLAVGKVFCAESMFCRPELGGTDASKVALVWLRRLVIGLGFEALDAQIINDHTARFGTYEMDGEDYLDLVGRLGLESPKPWPPSGRIDLSDGSGPEGPLKCRPETNLTDITPGDPPDGGDPE